MLVEDRKRKNGPFKGLERTQPRPSEDPPTVNLQTKWLQQLADPSCSLHLRKRNHLGRILLQWP
jgi:hypothetical protein